MSKKTSRAKIAIVGVGNLGLALAKCWIYAGLCQASDLVLFERDRVRRRRLGAALKLRNLSMPLEAVGTVQVVVLAVKPQDFPAVAKQLRPLLQPKQIVLSVMAGVPIRSIARSFPHNKRIVRCMPNLAVGIRQGATVYTCSAAVSKPQRLLVSELLRATGLALYVPQEQQIDFANALSGCGPGYIYYLLEEIEARRKALGFKPSELKHLVAQTIVGSTLLWLSGEISASELKRKVASKRGTTQAALDYFESERLAQKFVQGVLLALERARKIRSELDAALH